MAISILHVLQTDAVFILRLKKEPLIDHARGNAIVATCCGVEERERECRNRALRPQRRMKVHAVSFN
ncbi:MAG: hypothetical protein WB781_21770, partial [Candidatus Sulfotelmatobacter sp.]